MIQTFTSPIWRKIIFCIFFHSFNDIFQPRCCFQFNKSSILPFGSAPHSSRWNRLCMPPQTGTERASVRGLQRRRIHKQVLFLSSIDSTSTSVGLVSAEERNEYDSSGDATLHTESNSTHIQVKQVPILPPTAETQRTASRFPTSLPPSPPDSVSSLDTQDTHL